MNLKNEKITYFLTIILLFVFINCILLLNAFSSISAATVENNFNDFEEPVIDGVIEENEYKYSEIFDGLEIYWSNDKESIFIGLKAETEGYISIGLQAYPEEKMKNSDLILGLIKEDEAIIIDMYSTGEFGPHYSDEKLGGEDSIIDFEGTEINGITTIEFTRLLDTEDEYDIVLEKGINKMIWAYSNSDDADSKHTNKGYFEIMID